MKKVKLNFAPIKKYLRPYKKILFVAGVFVVLENAIQLILPVFYGKAIDVVVHEKTFSREIF